MQEFIRYKDFGAVGDGITNDFFAIKKAHEEANRLGLPVVAEAGKCYLIGNMEVDGIAETISIKTDTDWRGCIFIFDDREIAWRPEPRGNHDVYIFTVESEFPAVKLPKEKLDAINKAGGLDSETAKKIDTGLGYPALLYLENSDERKFIRFGGNQNSGTPQREIIEVDEEGNISPDTPLMFSFEKLTAVTAYRLDVRPITVKNAVIISRSSEVNLVDQYHSINRGIRIVRPNTTLLDIDHIITGQREKGELVDGVPFIGHSYNGVLAVQFTSNVLIKNVSLMSRIHYLQGTYDLDATYANRVTFKDCRQKDFFTDEFPEHYQFPNTYKCWGVMGSSYCKNLTYDGCALTRFDAHQGVWNAKVLNSDMAVIRLTGGGDFYMENTKIYFRNYVSPIQLREDYGSTWRGTITLKDCKMVDICKNGCLQSLVFLRSPNWNFGYQTYFPNFVIDNLEFEGAREVDFFQKFENNPQSPYFYRSVEDEAITTLGAIGEDGKENVSPYVPPKFIKVINNEKNGYKIKLPRAKLFENTEISGDGSLIIQA